MKVLKKKEAYDEMSKKLQEALKRVFRPEFINRLDGVIIFRMLNRENIRAIVSLELDKLAERLEDHQIKLLPSEKTLEYLSEEGYDPDMGARPLRRVIQQKVEDKLSDALLAHQFKDGEVIRIDVDDDGQIILKNLDEVEGEGELPPQQELPVRNGYVIPAL